MSSAPTFAVGIRSTQRNLSGFNEIIALEEGKLHLITVFRSRSKQETSTLCYIKHRSGIIIPRHLNTSKEDRSDYLFVVVAQRYIEVFRDVHYKIENNIALEPSCVLVPTELTTKGNKTVQLHYANKLLYFTAMEKFTSSIFFLNLPDGYYEVTNMDTARRCPSFNHENSDINFVPITSLGHDEEPLNHQFYETLEYFGEPPHTEIVFFLYHYERTPSKDSLPFNGYYSTDEIFAPSVEIVNPLPRTPMFSQINPVDPFSVICYLRTMANSYDIRVYKWDLLNYFLLFLRKSISYKKLFHKQTMIENNGYVHNKAKRLNDVHSLNDIMNILFNQELFGGFDGNCKVRIDELVKRNGIYSPELRAILKYSEKPTISAIPKPLHRAPRIRSSVRKSLRQFLEGRTVISSWKETTHIYMITDLELTKQIDLVRHISQKNANIVSANFQQYLDLCRRIETYIAKNALMDSEDDGSASFGTFEDVEDLQILTFKIPESYNKMLMVQIHGCRIHYYGIRCLIPLFTIDLSEYIDFQRQILSKHLHFSKSRGRGRRASLRVICLNLLLFVAISSKGIHVINTALLQKDCTDDLRFKDAIQSIDYDFGNFGDFTLVLEKLQIADDQLHFDVIFKLIIVSVKYSLSSFQCKFSSSDNRTSIELLDKIYLTNSESTYGQVFPL